MDIIDATSVRFQWPAPPLQADAHGIRQLEFKALGTNCSIKFRLTDERAALVFAAEALGWIGKFEAKFSRFQANSLISRINAAASTAIVTVRIPPAITRQAARVTIASGKTAKLKVLATGTTPSFQWFRGAAGNTKSPVKGAKPATLTTPPLNATTSFWVRVTNLAGTVNSKAVVVTVKAAAARTS